MRADEQRSLTALLRSSASWFLLILWLASSALITYAGHEIWLALSSALGRWTAVLTLAGSAAVIALTLGMSIGPLRRPSRSIRIRIVWAARNVPYWLRDLLGGFSVGDGKQNRRWSREDDFIAEDSRRSGPPQRDFGVAWRDEEHGPRSRVTYVLKTGEVVAVAHEGPVELLASFRDLKTVEALLDQYDYAAIGGWSLPWIRRRLAGWRVPLPPIGERWREEDEEPPKRLPQPPLPTTEIAIGAYVGHFRDDDLEDVKIVIPGNVERPLYHYVEHSPTGFAWGYGGSGPTDLARSLLADRLGYLPSDEIVYAFRNDIIAPLDRDQFVLTFKEVDDWIWAHRKMFARNPWARVRQEHE